MIETQKPPTESAESRHYTKRNRQKPFGSCRPEGSADHLSRQQLFHQLQYFRFHKWFHDAPRRAEVHRLINVRL